MRRWRIRVRRGPGIRVGSLRRTDVHRLSTDDRSVFGARLPIAENANIRIAEQYLIDTCNTACADGEYPIAIGDKGRLRLRGQYADQQSVGGAGLGAFNTWMAGFGGICERGPFSAQVARTQTGRGRETLASFGQNPSCLHMMQVVAAARAVLRNRSLEAQSSRRNRTGAATARLRELRHALQSLAGMTSRTANT